MQRVPTVPWVWDLHISVTDANESLFRKVGPEPKISERI